MQIFSVVYVLILLLHAEMLTTHITDRNHQEKSYAESTAVNRRPGKKYTINLNKFTLERNILEDVVDKRDYTTNRNIAVFQYNNTIWNHTTEHKTYWDRRLLQLVNQSIFSPHRFRRKAHFHYKTGQSYQHYRKHHLKTTVTTNCKTTPIAKPNATLASNVTNQLHSKINNQTKRTTKRDKTHIWKNFFFFNRGHRDTSTTQENTAPDDTVSEYELNEDEEESITHSISNSEITTPNHETPTHNTEHQTNTTIPNHEKTTDATSSHESPSHNTSIHETTTHTPSINETITHTASSNKTTQAEINRTTEATNTATENNKKKLFKWILHPHIVHRNVTHYEVEDRYYMSILVVADKSFTNFHRNTDYDTYILTVMNMAANYIRDVTFGVSLELVIVETIYLQEEGQHFDGNTEISRRLENFCEWAQKINPKDTGHPTHHDVAVLVTRERCARGGRSVLGASYMGGACVAGKSCLLAQDSGLLLGVNIARQLGHLLGASNDDGIEGRCPAESADHSSAAILSRHVMAPVPQHGSLVWSNCSRRGITFFFRQGLASCLVDVPPKSLVVFPEILPGVMYDADRQCQLATPGSRACYLNPMEFCGKLFCHVGSECVYNGDRPAQGTPCGVNKWCWNGACVHRGHRPLAVSGGWAAWGEWSACSRSCGAGVQRSRRACAEPPPHAGGRRCAGDAARHRTCRTQPCDPATPSFRALQCSAFDGLLISGSRHAWRPLAARAADPCGLYCAAGGVAARLAPRAADGTPCAGGANDLCVDGVCTRVGCDWVIGSRVAVDRCGVCGGEGTHCHLVQSWYNVSGIKVYDYKLIATIPKGSRKIRIVEAWPSANNLAISNTTSAPAEKEKFFLVGNKRVNAEGEFTIQSARGVLTHSVRGQDMILINGPLPIAIRLYLIPECNSASVHYSYMDIHVTEEAEKHTTEPAVVERKQRNPFLERNNPLHWRRYQWEYLEWSPCSVRCQTGTSVSAPHCVSVLFGRVSDSYCDAAKRPEPRVLTCNEHPCRARWRIGQWTACYNCMQWRKVRCVREARSYSSASVVVDNSYCHGIRPSTIRPCLQDTTSKCSDYNMLELYKVVPVTEQYTTRYYLNVLETEKRTPSEVLTMDFNRNSRTTRLLTREKSTRNIKGNLDSSGPNRPEISGVQETTEQMINSISVADIPKDYHNFQAGLEYTVPVTSIGEIGTTNYFILDETEMKIDVLESTTSSSARTRITSDIQFGNSEPTYMGGSEINRKFYEEINTIDPTLYISKTKMLETINDSFSSTESTLTTRATILKNILFGYTTKHSKRKSFPVKRPMLTELRKFLFSKPIKKREVMNDQYINLHNKLQYKDDKNIIRLLYTPHRNIDNKTHKNGNETYIILQLKKDCVKKFNILLDNSGIIKLIFTNSSGHYLDENHPLGKISTGIEDKNGNKIYDFDDILHRDILKHGKDISKVRFTKNLYANEFITKIPMKLLNSVVSLEESTTQSIDQINEKTINIWLSNVTTRIVFTNSNEVLPETNMSVIVYPTAKHNMQKNNETSFSMNHYLKNGSKSICSDVGQKNNCICWNLNKAGVNIQSLYSIINLYCDYPNHIIGSYKNMKLINNCRCNDPEVVYSTPQNKYDAEHFRDELTTKTKYEGTKNYKILDKRLDFIEVTLKPIITKKYKGGTRFFKNCGRLFRPKIKHSQVMDLTSSPSFSFLRPRVIRNVLRGLNLETNSTKSSHQSNSCESTHTTSIDFTEAGSTDRQPRTVTPKSKQNKSKNTNKAQYWKKSNEKCNKSVHLLNEVLNDFIRRNTEYKGTRDLENSLGELVPNYEIVKDFLPIDKIVFEKIPILGTNDLINNLTENSNRELGDDIPTLYFGSRKVV